MYSETAPDQTKSQLLPPLHEYKYFEELFLKENQKSLLKDLNKAKFKQVASNGVPTSMNEMEFKLAVIRRQQLKNEIKQGRVNKRK